MALPVIDIFAGPGGLSEGFSAFEVDGCYPFSIACSIEKEVSAHRTLRFRAFYRKTLRAGISLELSGLDPADPTAEDLFKKHPDAQVRELWAEAESEALRLELASDELTRSKVRNLLGALGEAAVLIGGPPCQAYSIAGRVRNKAIAGYVPEADDRHFLYREYVEILREAQPRVFVMENVKGLLSAQVEQRGIFQRIVEDLEGVGYQLVSLAPKSSIQTDFCAPLRPEDFVIRAEDFGVPQTRHRVILLGVRNDIAERVSRRLDDRLASWINRFFVSAEMVSTGATIHGLPRLKTRISRRGSDTTESDTGLREQIALLRKIHWPDALDGEQKHTVMRRLDEVEAALLGPHMDQQEGASFSPDLPAGLRRWLEGTLGGALFNHEPRSHMVTDLGRYLFAALYAEVTGHSPTSEDFPAELAPAHKNWGSGKFADRFRVQVASRPAKTVTSHIAKDGNYFIHPDPSQCRSLTVREAARLQTFPDDYIFFGNRTQQYVQVGNAVPPYLAFRIAKVVYQLLTAAGDSAQRSSH